MRLQSASVKLVGLGGGIGAGKSTVSALLAQRFGAVIIDADKIARQIVEPGRPALAKIVERFGADLVDEHGALRRQRLADIVFSNADELAALNAITHPAIREEMGRQVVEYLETDRVVVYDAALLFESDRAGMVGRMVVDVDPETAIGRLVQHRGLAEADARARIAAQMPRAERVAQADLVIDNSGTEEELGAEVERAWAWIGSLPASPIRP